MLRGQFKTDYANSITDTSTPQVIIPCMVRVCSVQLWNAWGHVKKVYEKKRILDV